MFVFCKTTIECELCTDKNYIFSHSPIFQTTTDKPAPETIPEVRMLITSSTL